MLKQQHGNIITYTNILLKTGFYGSAGLTIYLLSTIKIDDSDKAVKALSAALISAGLSSTTQLLRRLIHLKQKFAWAPTTLARSVILSSIFLQMKIFSYIHKQPIDPEAVPMTKQAFITWTTGMFALAFGVNVLPHAINAIIKHYLGKDLTLPAFLDLIWKMGQFGTLAGFFVYALRHGINKDDPLSFANQPTLEGLAISMVVGASVITLPSLIIEKCIYRLFIKPRISNYRIRPKDNKGRSENEPLLSKEKDEKQPRHWLDWLEQMRFKNYYILAKFISLLPKTTALFVVYYLAQGLGTLYANIEADNHTDIDQFAENVQSVALIFGTVLGLWAYQMIYDFAFKKTPKHGFLSISTPSHLISDKRPIVDKKEQSSETDTKQEEEESEQEQLEKIHTIEKDATDKEYDKTKVDEHSNLLQQTLPAPREMPPKDPRKRNTSRQENIFSLRRKENAENEKSNSVSAVSIIWKNKIAPKDPLSTSKTVDAAEIIEDLDKIYQLASTVVNSKIATQTLAELLVAACNFESFTPGKDENFSNAVNEVMQKIGALYKTEFVGMETTSYNEAEKTETITALSHAIFHSYQITITVHLKMGNRSNLTQTAINIANTLEQLLNNATLANFQKIIIDIDNFREKLQQKNRIEQLPLSRPCIEGNITVVNQLLEHGENPLQPLAHNDAELKHPLHQAIQAQQQETVNIIMEFLKNNPQICADYDIKTTIIDKEIRQCFFKNEITPILSDKSILMITRQDMIDFLGSKVDYEYSKKAIEELYNNEKNINNFCLDTIRSMEDFCGILFKHLGFTMDNYAVLINYVQAQLKSLGGDPYCILAFLALCHQNGIAHSAPETLRHIINPYTGLVDTGNRSVSRMKVNENGSITFQITFYMNLRTKEVPEESLDITLAMVSEFIIFNDSIADKIKIRLQPSTVYLLDSSANKQQNSINKIRNSINEQLTYLANAENFRQAIIGYGRDTLFTGWASLTDEVLQIFLKRDLTIYTLNLDKCKLLTYKTIDAICEMKKQNSKSIEYLHITPIENITVKAIIKLFQALPNLKKLTISQQANVPLICKYCFTSENDLTTAIAKLTRIDEKETKSCMLFLVKLHNDDTLRYRFSPITSLLKSDNIAFIEAYLIFLTKEQESATKHFNFFQPRRISPYKTETGEWLLDWALQNSKPDILYALVIAGQWQSENKANVIEVFETYRLSHHSTEKLPENLPIYTPPTKISTKDEEIQMRVI